MEQNTEFFEPLKRLQEKVSQSSMALAGRLAEVKQKNSFTHQWPVQTPLHQINHRYDIDVSELDDSYRY